jgi:hypothetical protein
MPLSAAAAGRDASSGLPPPAAAADARQGASRACGGRCRCCCCCRCCCRCCCCCCRWRGWARHAAAACSLQVFSARSSQCAHAKTAGQVVEEAAVPHLHTAQTGWGPGALDCNLLQRTPRACSGLNNPRCRKAPCASRRRWSSRTCQAICSALHPGDAFKYERSLGGFKQG